MCVDCGCGKPTGISGPQETASISLFQHLHQQNQDLAAHNREHFSSAGTLVLNLMSSPGAGKTALLEATLRTLQKHYRCAVLEGDLETELDAQRIRALDIPVIQITTGSACHLDAQLVHKALHGMNLAQIDLLFIENVGNLVCPASFDLGQHLNVVLLSVTEGDDKPAKYPVMFRTADLLVISKLDLLPHVGDFRVDRAENFLRALANPAPIISLSARSRAGLDEWLAWLHAQKAGSSVDQAMAVENGGAG
ncbi:hydrogenase nickel incorporation protein HypB [Halomonas sp. ZH2S]|uniref:Hydrogenase maturation factor HypB n=1 Tax=Vreelandella zhuhanensis TaxID=2684210 RepID=A0A7X3H0A0_9GAMM|nr:hydrogenase nickel incorporation protein HypB [Halomonas zhuhanensis]MWJ28166.1 hydrogenase nickel incorporation protein HypB [Halomonas zhuhanensis]